nr:lipopolysaccharide biosynthesis protein [Polaromonas sp. OV174]
MSLVRRSLAYSFANSYIALPLQLVGTMIISRLLTPEETGVFAVAAVFAAVASTFRDFGVTEYLIQEKNLTDEKIRASFTVNIIISWLMGLALFFSAPLASEYYRSVGIKAVMQVQAFNFLLIPFGAVTMANFRRLLDFRPIFIASSFANITTFLVAILLAFNGFSYMSLAWSSLAGVIVTVGTSMWFRPSNFPKWPGFKGVGDVIHFGKFVSGIFIIGQLGKNSPEMIIGRVQNMTGVALFSRANGLVELFNRTVLRAVMPVCMPYFAKSNRQLGSMNDGYLLSISFITAIGWPFMAFFGIVAFSAIRIIYGLQWMASVPLAQILCIVGAIELVHTFSQEALMAGGEIKRTNVLQIGLQLSRIAGILVVIPFGLIGACWGLVASASFNLLYTQWHLNKAMGLSLRGVLRACAPSFYITILTIMPIAIWVGFEKVTEQNYLWLGFGGGGITGVIWLLTLFWLDHPLWIELNSIAKRLYSRRPTWLQFK